MFNIGIFIYHDAEVLDFCGPFEVFTNVKLFTKDKGVEVFTVAEQSEIVNAQGLRIMPNYNFTNCPKLDIFLIPGGSGMSLTENEGLKEFIRLQTDQVQKLLSVCTGSLVYRVLGLLDGLEVTTHFDSIEILKRLAPKAKVNSTKRYVDNGKIVTSAGISAGIDMSLHVCEEIWGLNTAISIAKYMEYDWQRTEKNVSLAHLFALINK